MRSVLGDHEVNLTLQNGKKENKEGGDMEKFLKHPIKRLHKISQFV